MTALERRELDLEKFKLAPGQHSSIDEGACVMEAVAYIAGEPFSDHPKCASPVITRFCIKLNDRWSDADRQKLKPFILRIAGTAADEATERKRAYICADWACRELLPLVCDWRKMDEWAAKLRALPPVVDKKSAEAARAIALGAREAADAYAAAAAADAAYAYADAYAAAAYAYAAAYAAADADAADADADAYAAKSYRSRFVSSALACLDRLIAVTEGKR